ncbi:MAG TPA: O-antigen ligase family protein [Ramlibacter sp.]|nr:O-antigen ligase family protein [Ramlibacter sp.]
MTAPTRSAFCAWRVLVAMVFLAPALGVPHEEMLQDTFKSIIMALCALLAATLLLWQRRDRSASLHWHAALWLPTGLAAYAALSTTWSHAWLAATEAVRWSLLALIAWVALNTLTTARVRRLAEAAHWGAVVACVWAALQFWLDLKWFPQGPAPGSTFLNRNFFAEYAVCVLPFSFLLLAQARSQARIIALAASTGLIVLTLLMTGTRSALLTLAVQLLVALPLVAWRLRRCLAWSDWDTPRRALAACAIGLVIIGGGLMPTGNPRIAEEGRGLTPLARALNRGQAITASDESLGLRLAMWRATVDMIEDSPITGVGAGAWENEIPLYQSAGEQLETDYHAHNEALQLVAEYGLVGWAFVVALLVWLASAASRTWRLAGAGDSGDGEAPERAALLGALLSMLVVSNAGFPWHMAATGALFALCLGALAAADARLGVPSGQATVVSHSRGRWGAVAAGAMALCFALGVYVSWQAAQVERKLVRAAQLAMQMAGPGAPHDAAWEATRQEVVQWVRETIAIHPHYRKITPLIGDELARAGDWADALWIWESVLRSRPFVVAIITNVARAYTELGELPAAWAALERARELRPDAPSVRSLEVVLLARQGQEPQALARARDALNAGIVDVDLLNAAFMLAWRQGDLPLAERAMALRLSGWPAQRAQGYVQLGRMREETAADVTRALDAYGQALASAGAGERAAIAQAIPRRHWAALGISPTSAPN